MSAHRITVSGVSREFLLVRHPGAWAYDPALYPGLAAGDRVEFDYEGEVVASGEVTAVEDADQDAEFGGKLCSYANAKLLRWKRDDQPPVTQPIRVEPALSRGPMPAQDGNACKKAGELAAMARRVLAFQGAFARAALPCESWFKLGAQPGSLTCRAVLGTICTTIDVTVRPYMSGSAEGAAAGQRCKEKLHGYQAAGGAAVPQGARAEGVPGEAPPAPARVAGGEPGEAGAPAPAPPPTP